MAEFSRSWSTVCSTSHGFQVQYSSGKWGRKSHAPCFCCTLTLNLSNPKTSWKLSRVNDFVMVPVDVDCKSCGTRQPKVRRRLCFSTAGRGNMVTFSSFSSGLIGEEEEVNVNINSRGDQALSGFEKMQPLWSTLTVQEELSADHQGFFSFSNSSYSSSSKIERNLHVEKMEPPWGTLTVEEELSADHMDSLTFHDLDCSSSSKIERIHCLSELKLHYLEERDEEILSKRILSLSRSNKVRSALELYTSVEASGIQPNAHACNSLLMCLVRNGSLDDAVRVFEIMRRKEVTTDHAYSLILKAVANAQGCDSALKMFMDMEGKGTSKRRFDVIVYNTMISVCGKAKNWLETERMWRRIRENDCCINTVTYSLLVSAFVQCGQAALAIAAYHEMIQNGLEPSEDITKAIVASCTKEGEWTVALNVFQKMLDNGIKPTIITYNSLINCLGKAGKDELAFSIYNHMKSSGHTPDVYTWNALLSALYRSNRYADALQLFETIRGEKCSELNAHICNTALMSCQRLSLWEKSLQLLWLMEATGISVSTASYNLVISTCENARKPQVALQVYQHMIHKKCGPDTFTYLSMIRACVWGCLWNEIEEILEHVAPNSSLYNAVIQGCCLRGKITLAKKLYTRMQSIRLMPDGKTRALMLQHLSKNSVGKHPRYHSLRHH